MIKDAFLKLLNRIWILCASVIVMLMAFGLIVVIHIAKFFRKFYKGSSQQLNKPAESEGANSESSNQSFSPLKASIQSPKTSIESQGPSNKAS